MESGVRSRHYPINPAWRVEGQFEPYNPPKSLAIVHPLGDEIEESPGAAAFRVGGKTYRLEAMESNPNENLFFVFSDLTTGTETYKGGRFLEASPPDKNGKVILDFNKAFNPPCVFTPYQACPLPPAQNRLPFKIEAGEKKYSAVQLGDK